MNKAITSKQVTEIFIDADGCPVKDEVYKVAARYKIKVWVVANTILQVPSDPLVEMTVAPKNFDGVDDWIVEKITDHDIVITSDILLAQRCITKGACAIDPKGHEFTEDNIGSAVAQRELMQNLRYMGEVRGGPAPMNKKFRSEFLSKLDQVIHALKKRF